MLSTIQDHNRKGQGGDL